MCPIKKWVYQGEFISTACPDDDPELEDFFVDSNNQVYVLDCKNILMTTLKSSANQPQLKSPSWNVSQRYLPKNPDKKPKSLFVTSDGTIYIDNGAQGTIDAWSSDGYLRSIAMGTNKPCYGLFVDNNDTIYCSTKDYIIIMKKSLGIYNNSWISAVNTKEDHLRDPQGIFVNDNFDLYVADYGNGRIIRFKPGQKVGETIEPTEEISDHWLDGPTDITLDAENNLYIVDNEHSRIIFINSNFTQYRCLVGCSGKSNSWGPEEPEELDGISFDRSGNMLISDPKRKQILKFTPKFTHPATNCVENSTGYTTTTYSPPRIENTSGHGNVTKNSTSSTKSYSTDLSTISSGTDDNKSSSETSFLPSDKNTYFYSLKKSYFCCFLESDDSSSISTTTTIDSSATTITTDSPVITNTTARSTTTTETDSSRGNIPN
ncbi:unnamed protein product [Adineta steineri]|uniref:Uncharacterized protein n=1 Tax=Adineta steineri TaxID=433720 RepID=A0A814QX76_9BILA|nr:unnamed protein product [Adineta steineri]